MLVNPPNGALPLTDPKTGKPDPSVGMSFLTGITNAINGTPNQTQPAVAPGVSQVTLGNGMNISSGAGSPNGVVAGDPGDLYTNTNGGVGSTLYVKESGAGTNTGWTNK